jgi:hypothetical protein
MRIKSNGNVGIGTTSPSAPLHIRTNNTTDTLLLESTGDSNLNAPDLILYRNSATPADADSLGIIKFRGVNDGTVGVNRSDIDYALIQSEIVDASDNAEKGSLSFWTRGVGSVDKRMTIDSDGNVGIGTASPSSKLEVKGTQNWMDSTNGDRMAYLAPTVDGGALIILDSNADEGIRLEARAGEDSYINNGGNVGIGTDSPTAPLHVVGKFANDGYGVFTASTSAPGVYVNKTDADLTQSTDYIHFRNTGQFSGEISYDGTDVVISQTSDARLKENIKDSGSGLNIVNNLQIRSFDWVGEKRKSKRFGFIAQEMHKVFKEAVKVGGEDENEEPWAISDSKLIPVLTKAIQEQQQIIDQLKSQNESQQSTINDLASRIETLENK